VLGIFRAPDNARLSNCEELFDHFCFADTFNFRGETKCVNEGNSQGPVCEFALDLQRLYDDRLAWNSELNRVAAKAGDKLNKDKGTSWSAVHY